MPLLQVNYIKFLQKVGLAQYIKDLEPHETILQGHNLENKADRIEACQPLGETPQRRHLHVGVLYQVNNALLLTGLENAEVIYFVTLLLKRLLYCVT